MLKFLSQSVVYSIALLVIAIGCGDDENSVNSIEAYNPFVLEKSSGMWITSSDDYLLAIWYYPTRPATRDVPFYNGPDPQFVLKRPYPNPSNSSFAISFALPIDTKYKISVIRVIGPDEDSEIVSNEFGRSILHSSPILWELDDSLSAGTHMAIWMGRDANGDRVLPGYYRIYLSAGSFLDWADVFHARFYADLPPGMLKPTGYK